MEVIAKIAVAVFKGVLRSKNQHSYPHSHSSTPTHSAQSRSVPKTYSVSSPSVSGGSKSNSSTCSSYKYTVKS